MLAQGVDGWMDGLVRVQSMRFTCEAAIDQVFFISARRYRYRYGCLTRICMYMHTYGYGQVSDVT
jgi:hypothetical protein